MKHRQLIFVLNILVLALLTQVVSAAPKATREELNVVTARLERLERALDAEAANSANKDGLIAMQMKLRAMKSELQALRGENENLRNELEQLQLRQRESFMAVDKRLRNREMTMQSEQEMAHKQNQQRSGMMKDDKPAQTEAKAEPVVVAADTEYSSETIDAYRGAFLLLKQRRYEESISAFKSFLVSYPNSKYSANAQYWLAEANYVTKRYDRALVEFQTVLDNYPTSNKVPDARLKIGYTQYELEQYDDARVTLTRLRSQFPNSTVAGLAQERLQRLQKDGH